MDIELMVQKIKNKNRCESLKVVDTKTCYLVIKVTLTGYKYGEACIDKIPPAQ